MTYYTMFECRCKENVYLKFTPGSKSIEFLHCGVPLGEISVSALDSRNYENILLARRIVSKVRYRISLHKHGSLSRNCGVPW